MPTPYSVNAVYPALAHDPSRGVVCITGFCEGISICIGNVFTLVLGRQPWIIRRIVLPVTIARIKGYRALAPCG